MNVVVIGPPTMMSSEGRNRRRLTIRRYFDTCLWNICCNVEAGVVIVRFSFNGLGGVVGVVGVGVVGEDGKDGVGLVNDTAPTFSFFFNDPHKDFPLDVDVLVS